MLSMMQAPDMQEQGGKETVCFDALSPAHCSSSLPEHFSHVYISCLFNDISNHSSFRNTGQVKLLHHREIRQTISSSTT